MSTINIILELCHSINSFHWVKRWVHTVDKRCSRHVRMRRSAADVAITLHVCNTHTNTPDITHSANFIVKYDLWFRFCFFFLLNDRQIFFSYFTVDISLRDMLVAEYRCKLFWTVRLPICYCPSS